MTRPLRVAVDATAVPGRRLGAGVYVTELLRNVDRADVELHVFAKQPDVPVLSELIPDATFHAVKVRSRPARIVWSHFLLGARLRRLRPDVFHGPHYTLPADLPCPGVVTFHDPTFFTLPELHERKKVAYFTRAARAGISRAARVVAVSDYARRGAVEHAGADPACVDMVHEGVDHSTYRPGPPGPAPGRPYVLFVGALEPRKDVPTLIRAFAALDVPHELVIVGPRAWGAAAVDEAIAGVGGARSGSIRATGFVGDDEKVRLFQGASLFVYPSIAEGFGVPVLEAMACGAPVVTTTGSAPEEVAGDAAVLVPPTDEASLRGAIARVLGDAGLAARLRRSGLERSRMFTWTRAAASTTAVWRRAAGRPGPS